VRFEITAAPLITMACHCTGCQRMTASAFSLSVAIPSAGFAVTQGEPVLGGLHGATHHYFCPHCMSWLFTRPEGIDWFVNVRQTMLNEAADLAPFVETWTSEKLSWVVTPAAHSYAALPPLEDYEGLLSGFAQTAPAVAEASRN
jgi:hypothetical protein